jgi:hypothetical protein
MPVFQLGNRLTAKRCHQSFTNECRARGMKRSHDAVHIVKQGLVDGHLDGFHADMPMSINMLIHMTIAVTGRHGGGWMRHGRS